MQAARVCIFNGARHIKLFRMSLPDIVVCKLLSSDAWEGYGMHVNKWKKDGENIKVYIRVCSMGEQSPGLTRHQTVPHEHARHRSVKIIAQQCLGGAGHAREHMEKRWRKNKSLPSSLQHGRAIQRAHKTLDCSA